MDAPQTKSVEYYRAAPTQPGMSYSIDLERVDRQVRPSRSPSDPPPVAPLAIKRKPAAIVVPTAEVVRPPRGPARQPGYFDPDPHGPPGPPPMGPLPPLPDLAPPFGEADPVLLRAASAKERREARRQSKLVETADAADIAALERSMRRLSRISLASGTPDTSGPTSPTISLDSHLMSPSLRAEKLLRRISRLSDHGVRLPADYGRVGISGYSVPNSPGLKGVPPPLEQSELAYLVDKPPPALSVPMRRTVESQSAPGTFAPPQTNSLGLGLGLVPMDSSSTLPSITSSSSLASDTPSLSTLPSEATIKPTKPEVHRTSRFNSLSSAATASTTSLLTPVSPPTSISALPPNKSPMSPPRPLRMKGSVNPGLHGHASLPIAPRAPPSPTPNPARLMSPDIPDLLFQYRDSLVLPVEASYRESTVLPDGDSSVPQRSPIPKSARAELAPSPQVSRAPSPSGMVQPTRLRPGARPRTHSDLVPPEVPPKDTPSRSPEPSQLPRSPVPRQQTLPQSLPMTRSPAARQFTLPVTTEPEPRSSTETWEAVEDGGEVLDVPPMRQSLESQVTPRPSIRTVGRSASRPTIDTGRPASPDISYILRTTPRPSRKGSVGSMASSSHSIARRPSGMAPPSSFKLPVTRPGSQMSVSSHRSSGAITASSAGLDAEGQGPEVFYGEQYDSADSDSDLDLSTPLPHMMLRAGLLSPRSTIITEAMEPRASGSGLSARGEALRAKGEKVWKAEARRKIRHRDGQNLRDGVGLTTGLGWSDSEDEDAPSPLRRKLSSVLLAKAQSRPSSQLSRHYSTVTLSRRSTYSNLDSTSVSSSSQQSLPRTPATHPLSLPLTPSSLPGASREPGADEFGKLDFPMPPTATSWRGMPSPGLRKAPSNGMMRTASATSPRASGSITGHGAISPGGMVPPSSMRARSTSGASSVASSQRTSVSHIQSPRTSASTSARSSLVKPAPRAIKVNVRPPTGTRLSAPEALRQAQAAPLDGSRRLSGA